MGDVWFVFSCEILSLLFTKIKDDGDMVHYNEYSVWSGYVSIEIVIFEILMWSWPIHWSAQAGGSCETFLHSRMKNIPFDWHAWTQVPLPIVPAACTPRSILHKPFHVILVHDVRIFTSGAWIDQCLVV